MFTWVNLSFRELDQNKISKRDTEKGLDVLSKVDSILGVLDDQDNIPKEIQELVDRRERARRENQWKESDKIRESILSKGYKIEDSPEGSICKKI